MIFVDFLQKSGVFCRFCRRKFFGRYACGNPIKTAPFSLIFCVPYGTSTPRTAAYRAICSTRISSTRSTLSTKSTHRSRALRQVTLARLAVCEARPPHRPSLVILYAPPLRAARPGVTALIPLFLSPRPLSLFYGRNETLFSFDL